MHRGNNRNSYVEIIKQIQKDLAESVLDGIDVEELNKSVVAMREADAVNQLELRQLADRKGVKFVTTSHISAVASPLVEEETVPHQAVVVRQNGQVTTANSDKPKSNYNSTSNSDASPLPAPIVSFYLNTPGVTNVADISANCEEHHKKLKLLNEAANKVLEENPGASIQVASSFTGLKMTAFNGIEDFMRRFNQQSQVEPRSIEQVAPDDKNNTSNALGFKS